MFAEFMAALKAIAAIPQILQELKSGISAIAVAHETAKLKELRDEVARITDRINNTTDRQELLRLARDLNRVVSK